MENILNKFKRLIAVNVALFFSFLFKHAKKKKHWVIIERGVDARDNAYFFYEYMKKERPERKVYFIIDKKSADFNKVKEDAVAYGSLNSYLKLFSAEKIISTHYGKGIPNLSARHFKLSELHKNYYFLQHGVIKDCLDQFSGKNAPMRLFVCGAYPEYKYVNETFGHPKGVVRYTGLVRFDNLHEVNIKRQILVMPTWRQKYEDKFEKSVYFRKWNSFLNNQDLLEALHENDLDLIFYPHFRVQKHLEFFNSKSKRVVIASFNDYDVQTLLKESAVLVTDFSSVYFDFAYMKKPLLYYQFDREEFFKNHYKKGYFDYDDMGFGKVCVDEEGAVQELLSIIKNGLKADEFYLKRTENFFPLNDNKNAERVYEAIINQ